jgi:glycerophosphoryl diester phosphodiesterase
MPLPTTNLPWPCTRCGVHSRSFEMSDTTVKRPLKVAHRGGAGLAPENTLAAFQNALDLKTDAVELDLHMSQDGALVVIHDPDVGNTTDGIGEVGSLTLAELKTLNAAAKFKGVQQVEPQHIPTLEEVLVLVQGRARVQIEIKRRNNATRYTSIEARVLEVLRRTHMLHDVRIISFDFPTLQEIKALAPNLRTCALISSKYLKRFNAWWKPDSVVQDLVAHGFDCVGVKHSRLTRQLLQSIRARGFQVGVWTVNNPGAMRKFVDMGVDFITSDRPDLLNDILT